MKTKNIIYPLTLILLSSIAFSTPVLAKLNPNKASEHEWHSASTSNFTVITDKGKKKAIQLAQNLERFRSMFELLANVKLDNNIRPIKLFATTRISTYSQLRDWARAGKNSIGFFDDTINGNYSALKLDGRSTKNQLSAIFHEYTHYLNANLSSENSPFWYSEGFADYMGEIEFEDDKTILYGKPNFRHIANIGSMYWMPLYKLLNTSHIDSKKSNKRYQIYSQGWLLVHYFNSNSERIKQNRKFLELIANGIKPKDAIEQSTGLRFSDFEKALRKYSRQRKHSYSRITLGDTLDNNEIKIHQLKPDEVVYQLGEFALQTGHNREDAKSYFEKALSINPQNADALAGLANSYLGVDDKKMTALITKAKEIEPDNPWIATVSGHLNFRKMRLEKDEKLKQKFWNLSVRDYNKAINSGEINVEAIYGASSLYSSKRRYKKALELMLHAYGLAPSNHTVRTNLINLYLANQNFEKAQTIADKVTNNHHSPLASIEKFEKWYVQQINLWEKYHLSEKLTQ